MNFHEGRPRGNHQLTKLKKYGNLSESTQLTGDQRPAGARLDKGVNDGRHWATVELNKRRSNRSFLGRAFEK